MTNPLPILAAHAGHVIYIWTSKLYEVSLDESGVPCYVDSDDEIRDENTRTYCRTCNEDIKQDENTNLALYDYVWEHAK